MNLIAGGHEETERNWPGPLQRGGLWVWALPVVLLSSASIGVFLVVLGFVQRTRELRTLFSLDVGGHAGVPLIVGALAAALAWTIAGRCRHRPGPLWPRLWALLLALLSSAVTVILALGFRPDLGPLQQAVALASAAAALTLAPRLLRLHPDSPWVQRIAPVSLAFVLLGVLPVAYYLGSDTVGNRIQRLQSKLGEIDRQIERLGDCGLQRCSPGEFGPALALLERLLDTPLLWESASALEPEFQLGSRLDRAVGALAEALAPGLEADFFRAVGAPWPRDSVAAEQRLKRIQALRIGPFKALSRASAKVGRPEPTRRALETAATVLIAAMGPELAPRLHEAPVIYAPGDGPYQRDPEFPAAAARIVEYFREIGRLFRELNRAVEQQPPSPASDQGLRQRRWRQDWSKQLAALEASWSDHWVMPFLGSDAGQAAAAPGLAQVLAMPVLGKLAASNLRGLLDVDRLRLGELLGENRAGNCERVDGGRRGTREADRFTLRCRAYAPGRTPEETALRVELRLIYWDAPTASAAKPNRLYFFFPVPAGDPPEGYLGVVEKALAEARTMVRDAYSREPLPLCSTLAVPRSCIGLEPFAPGQQYVKVVVYRNRSTPWTDASP